jgi:hypothetical protein
VKQVTFGLDDDVAAVLERQAAARGESLGEYIVAMLYEDAAGPDGEPDFERLAREIVERYRPVLHRLAE